MDEILFETMKYERDLDLARLGSARLGSACAALIEKELKVIKAGPNFIDKGKISTPNPPYMLEVV